MILVDSRVGSRDLFAALSKKVECTMENNMPGDFAFEGFTEGGKGLVGIERKTVSDALDCMLNGRLSGFQIPSMVETYQVCYLIIEGLWRPEPGTGLMQVWYHTTHGRQAGWTASRKGSRVFMFADFEHFLGTLMLMTPIKIIRTSNQNETVEVIASRFSWHQKPWNQHTSHLMIHTPAKPGDRAHVTFKKPPLRRVVAIDLPGVGYTRSKAVEEAFPNTLAVISASVEDLANVPGIGKITAKKIYETVRSE